METTGSNSKSENVVDINLSHYRPTPDQRRFSISTFAVTGQITWAAKPGGEFAAKVEVLKGAFAKMIPFKAMEASVQITTDGDVTEKRLLIQTIGGKAGDAKAQPREKIWNDVSVISAIEIPWVAEYALQRWNVGGPQEVRFSFEDNQRVREAVLSFRDDADSKSGDAMAILRVLKPGEAPKSLSNLSGAKHIKHHPDPRPGDVLVTFRDSKIAGFTVFVPIVGKLQFVSN